MNYLTSKLRTRQQQGGSGNGGVGPTGGPHLSIAPGAIEEAVHYMQFSGDIDLSELYFSAEGQGTGVESFVDIAVFEVPGHCTSHNCDLSQFGVGALTHFNGITFLNLCQAGRLMIDNNIFQGHHTQLMIPSEGPMPSHIKRSAGTFKVPIQNRYYDVMIANCNEHGRRIQLAGQVVFAFEDNLTPILTARSLTILTTVAFAVCLVLSLLSIKIERGTRSDWEYQQFHNVEVEREEQERARLRDENDSSEDSGEEPDQVELRPATVA
jgi:hypothetical protein